MLEGGEPTGISAGPLRGGRMNRYQQAENQEEVKMKTSVFFGALTVAGLAAGAAAAGTLDDVKARGKLNCGVATGVPGFATPDANGVWNGFDVAVCRAVAAAVLSDPMAVEFVPTTGKTRFTALASGEIDMGWAWNQSELNLIWNGTPAKMVRDADKGVATWVCGYVHLKSSTTPVDQVYDLLNALSAPESGKYIIESWGYPHANSEAFPISDQALVKQYGFDDPKSVFEGSLFFDAVDPALEAKMLKAFERIKASF